MQHDRAYQAGAAATSLSRRRFAAGGAVAAGVWVAPSVVGLARVGATTASGAIAYTYTEDFQGAVGTAEASWSNTTTTAAPADANRRFLGEFAGDTVFLTIALPPHEEINLSFDLYIIESWDGGPSGTRNDQFQVSVDGSVIFNETFGQAANRPQTFGPLPTGNPAQTGAVEVDTLGYASVGDSVYQLSFTDVAHTASTITIAFSGVDVSNNELWGLDNLVFIAC